MTWVNSTGPKDAKICLIGEAPGVEEERVGFPFVGSSGRLLEGLLTKVGTTKARCYVTNVVKIRPPRNDFGVLYEDASRRSPTRELLTWHELLRRELSDVKANIIVPLGNEALYAVTGSKGVMAKRGSVYVIDGKKVMPTIHPAAILRMWEHHTLVQFDLKRAVVESRTPGYTYKPPLLHIRPSYSEVIDELTRLASSKYVSFDIETAGDLLTAIAFSDRTDYGFCVPFFKSYGEGYWDKDEELQILKHIKALLGCSVKKIAQNAQFDMTFLKFYYGIDVSNLWYDTMCMHSLVYAELPKGLATLTSIYTRHPYYKDMRQSGRFGTTLWNYNAMDAAVTYECAMELEKELHEMDMMKFYRTHINPLIYPLMDMQLRGVKVDLPRRAEARAELTTRLADLKTRLSNNVGYEFNPLSPKQVSDLLYNKLRLPTRVSRTTGKATTNQEALEKLGAKYPSPLFKLLLDYKKTSKVLGNWIDSPIDKDGRIRTSYVIGGTTTGRLASRKSLFGTGTNLQNLPPGWPRRLLIPDEGKIFIAPDLSQAEARAVAWLSEDEHLIQVFKSSSDIHRQLASWVFRTSFGQVTDEQRRLAKRLVFGCNYGMSFRAFAIYATVTERDAKALIERYFITFPRIRAWQASVRAELGNSRMLVTPLGRKRLFFGRWGEDLYRAAYAYVPQSIVGDLLNMILVDVWRAIQQTKIDMQLALQVHDEIVVQVSKDRVKRALEILSDSFRVSITVKRRSFTIPVGFKIGPNYNDLKKIDYVD